MASLLPDRFALDYPTYWVTSSGTPASESPHLVESVALVGIRAIIKRLMDIVFSAFFICLLSPTLLLIALAVKLSDPHGPTLIRQTRIGLHGRTFTLLKFRTTYWDESNEQSRADEVSPIVTRILDRRGTGSESPTSDQLITPIGHWLRTTGIDELPQLANVLVGDMSLVGPRPRFQDEILANWIDEDFRLMLVRPGITGLSQITPHALSPEGRVGVLDDYYLDHWTLRLDLLILLATLKRAVVGFDW